MNFHDYVDQGLDAITPGHAPTATGAGALTTPVEITPLEALLATAAAVAVAVGATYLLEKRNRKLVVGETEEAAYKKGLLRGSMDRELELYEAGAYQPHWEPIWDRLANKYTQGFRDGFADAGGVPYDENSYLAYERLRERQEQEPLDYAIYKLDADKDLRRIGADTPRQLIYWRRLEALERFEKSGAKMTSEQRKPLARQRLVLALQEAPTAWSPAAGAEPDTDRDSPSSDDPGVRTYVDARGIMRVAKAGSGSR